jgi:hypothetical protein
MTFEKASSKCKKKFGSPEEELCYVYESCKFIDWIWWNQGVIVTFGCSKHRNDRWNIVSTNFFKPEIELIVEE